MLPFLSPPRPTILAALLIAPALAACGRADTVHPLADRQVDSLATVAAELATAARPNPAPAVGTPALPAADSTSLPPGAVRITSTDGGVVYTLVRDTVRMQLSDTVVQKVRRQMNAASDSMSSKVGGFLAQTIRGAVGSAIGFVLKTPVRDIRSIRYDDGALRIETGSGPLHRSTIATGRKHATGQSSFTRADAERFIAAVESRQRALGVR